VTPQAYFAIGKSLGLRWYAESEPGVIAAGKGDKHLGAALIAATSPKTPILDNLRRAMRGDSPLPCHKSNLALAYAGQPLRGPKVEAFRKALLGDTDAIPLDVWMLRAYGLTDDLTMPVRRRVLSRINRAASKASCTPRDYAASIWCGIILAHGREPLHYGESLRRLQAQEELWESDKSS
jgi:hypothetical protein